jgi:sulfite exporter TauE/SafE
VKIVYVVMVIIGITLASYGFEAAINEKISNATLRSILMLVGIILMAMGLLLFGDPHFFSAAS